MKQTKDILKALKINGVKNLALKMFTEFKIGITFAPTVPVLLPIRTAHGSFFFYRVYHKINTPLLPLHDAH